jgi:hypothetical protein
MAENCHFLKGLLVPFKGKGELLAQVQEADQVHQWCRHQVRQLVAEFKNTFPDGRDFLPVSLQSQRAVSGEYIRWRKVGGDQRYVELQSPDGFALLSNLPPVVQQTLFEFNERVLQTNATRSLAYHRHRTLNNWLVKRQQVDKIKASLGWRD